MGIEPTSEAWEASILPLYDARSTGSEGRIAPRFPVRKTTRLLDFRVIEIVAMEIGDGHLALANTDCRRMGAAG